MVAGERSGEYPQLGEWRGDVPDRLQARRQGSQVAGLERERRAASDLDPHLALQHVDRLALGRRPRAGPSTAVNRVRPANTPSAWTGSCISLPGTSRSGSHSPVLTLEQNTPGCGSITTLLLASAGRARLSRRDPLARPRPRHAKGRRPRPDRTESARSAHTRPGEPIMLSDWRLSGGRCASIRRSERLPERLGAPRMPRPKR